MRYKKVDDIPYPPFTEEAHQALMSQAQSLGYTVTEENGVMYFNAKQASEGVRFNFEAHCLDDALSGLFFIASEGHAKRGQPFSVVSGVADLMPPWRAVYTFSSMSWGHGVLSYIPKLTLQDCMRIRRFIDPDFLDEFDAHREMLRTKRRLKTLPKAENQSGSRGRRL